MPNFAIVNFTPDECVKERHFLSSVDSENFDLTNNPRSSNGASEDINHISHVNSYEVASAFDWSKSGDLELRTGR